MGRKRRGGKPHGLELPGVSAFWNAFHKRGLDLVAVLFFQSQTAFVVRKGIATVTDWADVSETDLQRLCSGCRSRSGWRWSLRINSSEHPVT